MKCLGRERELREIRPYFHGYSEKDERECEHFEGNVQIAGGEGLITGHQILNSTQRLAGPYATLSILLSPSIRSLILDLQHGVPRRVENGLDRVLPVAGVDEAGSEEILAGGVRILEADLATITARRREGNRSRSC
ncbi:hypothetical protein Vadar_027869 [Vaccinium darrowii]|uniref:Uncharacterized protein n=3 Tax=Vaccinium darrowii TaxID=229202 RepID=A0ACB7ZL25_9ERIC|nr:hypothetical protein Vadar_023722 [Vaccinium darrowii]KAH7866843.1 hypothetical protein Vadar_025698 [Vaccinium darrowii]KAH7867015.1 hypothetical protein Vadar_027869 [Vaccinium darrowii]